MTLQEFVDDMRTKPDAFMAEFVAGNARAPDQWPLEMGEAEWFEQFLVWLESNA